MRECWATVTSVNILWEGNGGNKATTHKNKSIKVTWEPKFSSQQLLVRTKDASIIYHIIEELLLLLSSSSLYVLFFTLLTFNTKGTK